MIWMFIGFTIIMLVTYLFDRHEIREMRSISEIEKNKRQALEEIVGVKANSCFDVNSYNPQIRICDLQEVFKIICPIQIFINGQLIWDDNQIMEGWTTEDIRKFQDDYVNILNRKDKVKKFTFYTVAFHHSVVVIETEK